MSAYTSPLIPLPAGPPAQEAELVFAGVEQAGASFEARVFLNNPNAGEGTARLPELGYAGSFHVYGYGEPSPPAIAEAKARGGLPVAPIEKRLRADGRAVGTALKNSEGLTVTVVAVPADRGGDTPERPFERVSIVFR